MKTPEYIEAALNRLAAALDLLDAATERRARADALRANLEEELAVMQDDRSKLAVELDAAVARSRTLELANEEVARKLKNASASIRSLLTGSDDPCS